MVIKDYIGFNISDIMPLLTQENINYKIIETWDTKGTKMGDEVRIVNIKEKDIMEIYVAYF